MFSQLFYIYIDVNESSIFATEAAIAFAGVKEFHLLKTDKKLNNIFVTQFSSSQI